MRPVVRGGPPAKNVAERMKTFNKQKMIKDAETGQMRPLREGDDITGAVLVFINFLSLRDAGDPVELARRYDAEGADESDDEQSADHSTSTVTLSHRVGRLHLGQKSSGTLAKTALQRRQRHLVCSRA